LRPDFRYFAKLPHSGVNISGKLRNAPVKFSPLIKPSGRFRKCNEIADRVGYVGGEPRENRKKSRQSDIARAMGEKFTEFTRV